SPQAPGRSPAGGSGRRRWRRGPRRRRWPRAGCAGAGAARAARRARPGWVALVRVCSWCQCVATRSRPVRVPDERTVAAVDTPGRPRRVRVDALGYARAVRRRHRAARRGDRRAGRRAGARAAGDPRLPGGGRAGRAGRARAGVALGGDQRAGRAGRGPPPLRRRDRGLARAAALAAILVLARAVLPRLLALVARAHTPELFPLAALVVAFGTALGAARLGLSLPIGAFLAGLALSGSLYAHQVFAELLPLRDAFVAIFFTSIGMLFEPAAIAREPVLLAGMVGAVLFKGALIAAIVGLLWRSARLAILTGFGLAQ